MKRREFIRVAGAGAVGLSAAGGITTLLQGCAAPSVKADLSRRLILLGIDGLDPFLLTRYMDEGVLPNFKKLTSNAEFMPLGTSIPPQSPTAWSNVIAGAGPGVHGIFDFIHRDPATLTPLFSLTETEPPDKNITLGNLVIPLWGGGVTNLRSGPTFWLPLEEAGVPCTIFKIPANFPPTKCKSRTISGLGTPDVTGSYGSFQYYTDDPDIGTEGVTGGVIYKVRIFGNTMSSYLEGPANNFRKDGETTRVKLTVYRDPDEKVAKIAVGGRELILKEGEWSDWIRVSFDMLGPITKVHGICRLYMKQVHPNFSLYVTPINIDPADPAIPICTPGSYGKDLNDVTDGFYTQGFPEDTKALSHGVFSDEEFITQAHLVLDERERLLEYELDRFDEGLLFFYFSSIDQGTHMLWRCMDSEHPLYDPNAPPEVKDGLKNLYAAMDGALGKVLAKVDDRTTLMVMSDHGFAPFAREFNTNTWLAQNGFLAAETLEEDEGDGYFAGVDWRKTQAYAVGLNSVYVNRRGREPDGTVSPADADKLLDDIISKLKQTRDPENGRAVVGHVFKPSKVFEGPFANNAQTPDLIIGFNRGYRTSDGSALGSFVPEAVRTRTDKWAGDHCIDPVGVPGTFIANREVVVGKPNLKDIAPTVLAEFGLEPPGDMTGRALLKKR
ncbi:MAG: alkaline phosphatase family protein [Candidatus Coatesbacteria bacterium]|nr:MAG: alkaline phosphatase family protein [Candidatus Coatesbacteria bacterium]